MVGPTGVGKTEIALLLARKLGADIVSVDSMQIYRGMDLGTGKPPVSVRAEIRHHGIDLVEPEEEFDVLQYVRSVVPVVRAALERGRPLLLVGGAGLYFRTLRRGLCDAPGQEPELRARLLEEGTFNGASALHERLRAVDPAAASRIHPNDLKRIVRGLEVFEASGRPLSEWQERTEPAVPGLDRCPVVGLTRPRELLYARIDARVLQWLAAGWFEEARALHRRRLSRTAREALGYRELFDHLDGRLAWPEAVERIAQNTRRYAKRQWAWFRHEPGVEWMEIEGMAPDQVAERLWKKQFSSTSN